MDLDRNNRRLFFSAILVLLGMISLSAGLFFDLVYGVMGNAAWNQILLCAKAFPGGVKGDVLFSGRRLSCHPTFITGSVAVYMEPLIRNTDLDIISPLLIGVILFFGVVLTLIPIFKVKYRKGHYIRMLELAFGILGLICLATFSVIGFAMTESMDASSKVVNDFDPSFPNLLPGKVLPLPECNITLSDAEIEKKTPDPNKNTVCLREESWHLIMVKCVLNGNGILTHIGSRTSLKAEVKERNMPWKNDAITFNGSSTKYSYKDLQTLGFCPWIGFRSLAALFMLLATVCFFVVATLACCMKGGAAKKGDVTPDDPLKKEEELMEKSKKKLSWDDESSVTDLGSEVKITPVNKKPDLPSIIIGPDSQPIIIGPAIEPQPLPPQPPPPPRIHKKKRKSLAPQRKSLLPSDPATLDPEEGEVTQTKNRRGHKVKSKKKKSLAAAVEAGQPHPQMKKQQPKKVSLDEPEAGDPPPQIKKKHGHHRRKKSLANTIDKGQGQRKGHGSLDGNDPVPSKHRKRKKKRAIIQ